METKKYIPWLNLAKVIGLYLMILGHLTFLDPRFCQWIYSFHMPMFFMLSGITFQSESFYQSCVKVFRSLILPFIIISILWCLYYTGCYIHGERPMKEIVPFLVGTFVSPGKDFLAFHPFCITTWFLIALSINKLILALVIKAKKVQILLVLVNILFFLSAIVLSKLRISLLFAIDSALLAFPFFTFGFIMSNIFREEHNNIFLFVIFLITITMVTIISLNNGIVDINKNLYGKNIILFLACGLLGTIMIVSFSKLLCRFLNREKLINTLATGSLLIVGFSAMLSSIEKDLIHIIMPFLNTECNLFGIVLGFIVLMIFYPLTLFCRRFFPAIIGYRK